MNTKKQKELPSLSKFHPAYEELKLVEIWLQNAAKKLQKAHRACCSENRTIGERILARVIEDEVPAIANSARNLQALLSCFEED
jgi:hypothetical protein